MNTEQGDKKEDISKTSLVMVIIGVLAAVTIWFGLPTLGGGVEGATHVIARYVGIVTAIVAVGFLMALVVAGVSRILGRPGTLLRRNTAIASVVLTLLALYGASNGH